MIIKNNNKKISLKKQGNFFQKLQKSLKIHSFLTQLFIAGTFAPIMQFKDVLIKLH